MAIVLQNNDDQLAKILIQGQKDEQKRRTDVAMAQQQEDRQLVQMSMPFIQKAAQDPATAQNIMNHKDFSRLYRAYANNGLAGIFQVDQTGRPFISAQPPQSNVTQLTASAIQQSTGITDDAIFKSRKRTFGPGGQVASEESVFKPGGRELEAQRTQAQETLKLLKEQRQASSTNINIGQAATAANKVSELQRDILQSILSEGTIANHNDLREARRGNKQAQQKIAAATTAAKKQTQSTLTNILSGNFGSGNLPQEDNQDSQEA